MSETATPKEKVWFTEEELIENLQAGEIDWVFFVTHHTQEQRDEYFKYCADNALPSVLETTARDFYHEYSHTAELAM